MLGAEPKNRFKDLPPEPQFPYTLLKRIEPVKVILLIFNFILLLISLDRFSLAES
jgi:hypothetical protein